MQIEKSLISASGNKDWDREEDALMFLWGLLFLILTFPLCLVQYLGSLRYFAILGFSIPIYLALFLVAEQSTSLDHCNTKPTLKGLVFSVPIILFATTCQPNVGDVYQDLSHKERNGPLMLIAVMGTVFVLYFIVGLFGCMHFQHVGLNFLNEGEFPRDSAGTLVKVT